MRDCLSCVFNNLEEQKQHLNMCHILACLEAIFLDIHSTKLMRLGSPNGIDDDSDSKAVNFDHRITSI